MHLAYTVCLSFTNGSSLGFTIRRCKLDTLPAGRIDRNGSIQ